jgi:hypothetical protein
VEAWAEALGVTVSGEETARNPQEKPATASKSEIVAALKVDALKAEVAGDWNAAKQLWQQVLAAASTDDGQQERRDNSANSGQSALIWVNIEGRTLN